MNNIYGYERFMSHYIVVECPRDNPLSKKVVAHCDTVEECKEEIADLEKEVV